MSRAAHHTKQRQKVLGAFYTPPAMADALVEWAIRDSADRVLDPSFGAVVFLESARQRLVALDASVTSVGAQLFGADLDGEAVVTARRALPCAASQLHELDFFRARPAIELPIVDAVVGNPPYIRYQGFNASAGEAHRLARKAGVPLTRLASSWAPFLIHSTSFVAPSGRLALVLPAELLHAQYAEAALHFVCQRFSRSIVVAFEERVFPGAQEEVVLLLAEGGHEGRVDRPEFVHVRSVSDLKMSSLRADRPPRPSPARRGKLLSQLLPDNTQSLYERMTVSGQVRKLGSLARVSIGAVTGANAFFLLAREQHPELHPSLRQPAVSRAIHLRGIGFTSADWGDLVQSGAKAELFVANAEAAPKWLATATRYLAEGVEAGIPKRYKCRVRDPWWALPMPKGGPPDLFLTYCANDHPRLAANVARAVHTNTVHGLWLHQYCEFAPLALATLFFNSLTQLSAELVGRSYGGGVLKLEPTEAQALLVPDAKESALLAAAPAVDREVRSGNVAGAMDLVDEIALRDGLGLGPRQIAALRRGSERLRTRRQRRSRTSR